MSCEKAKELVDEKFEDLLYFQGWFGVNSKGQQLHLITQERDKLIFEENLNILLKNRNCIIEDENLLQKLH